MIVLDARFELSAPAVSGAPPADLPEFCFAGRSNVGKSSCLNALTRRHDLARVSKTPGRTRLLNFFEVELGSRPGAGRKSAKVRLCDLPGYGYAEAAKTERRTWGKMIEGYLAERPSLKAVVVLIDSEVGPQPKDHEMLEFLAGSPHPLIVVATKADKLARTRRGSQLDKIAKELNVPRPAVVPFSAHEGLGWEELWRTLCAAAGIFGKESEKLLGPASDEGAGTEE